MLKKIVIAVVIIALVGVTVTILAVNGSANKNSELRTVPVKRGTIIDKALAVGQIEPNQEIDVKSKIAGIVEEIYVDIGDRVKVGDPLFNIAPDPTPLEYTEAKRQVEIAQVTFDNVAREFKRVKSLQDKQLISHQEYEAKLAEYNEHELRLSLAREKLALIESGKTRVADRSIDNVIKSTINGTVLELHVEEGDPVVPLTSFQAGTELMTLAYMENLVFKGNVDEIDIGKVHEGMEAEIEIGAVPGELINGTVTRISPKAHKEEGTTLFEIEIEIVEGSKQFLRAGYSANANVIINKAEDILLAPERLIAIADSVSTVEVQDTLGVIDTVTVETGLSDGINVEVRTGLNEGDLLVERPPREITPD
jgi:HlyD family secretion protein